MAQEKAEGVEKKASTTSVLSCRTNPIRVSNERLDPNYNNSEEVFQI